MPRVVPSQVVAFIDQAFPNARAAPRFPVYSGNGATLAAILRLTDEIPGELITISGEDYSDLLHSLAGLALATDRWNQRGGSDPPSYIKDKSPVALVREMLAKCPDEIPSPTISQLTFIGDDELRDSIRADLSTANSALHNSEWKASTVLAGAVVEALLLWAIQANATALAALASKPTGTPEQWPLAELIDVAHRLRLIEQNTTDQAVLAKNFRNLIHPGRAQRLREACDRGTALTALAATELVIRDLTP